MAFLLAVPLLVDLYLLYNFLNQGHLINFHPQVPIPITEILLTLAHLRAQPLPRILILLQDVQHKHLPEVILIGAVYNSRHAVQFCCDLSGYEVEEVDISLVDHLGGVEEHVLLVAEGLDQEGQELADGGTAGLEELGVDHQADYLLYQALQDVVPSVFGEDSLD